MKKNIVLIGLALSMGVFACQQNKTETSDADETATVMDKEVMDRDGEADIDGENMKIDAVDVWKDVDLNAPNVSIPEVKIKSPDFETRGNDNYTVYSLGENVLFDSDKATLKDDAKQNLQQIANSIKQRYDSGQVRIYGHTDSKDTENHNQQLSEQRAEAVKNWLVQQGGIEESRISLNAMGEDKPIRSNQTMQGREQNRRVEIVALNNANQGNSMGDDKESKASDSKAGQ